MTACPPNIVARIFRALYSFVRHLFTSHFEEDYDMQVFLLFLLSVSAISTASPAEPQILMRNLLGLDQIPLENTLPPITRTRTVTHTHFEINVVSTVYRTRPQTLPTPAVSHSHARDVDAAEPPSEVKGEICDPEACHVCRMFNNCYEDGAPWWVSTCNKPRVTI